MPGDLFQLFLLWTNNANVAVAAGHTPAPVRSGHASGGGWNWACPFGQTGEARPAQGPAAPWTGNCPAPLRPRRPPIAIVFEAGDQRRIAAAAASTPAGRSPRTAPPTVGYSAFAQ